MSRKISVGLKFYLFLMTLFISNAFALNEYYNNEKIAHDKRNVFADELLSTENHAVKYIFPTQEGQDIALSFDYPDCSDCPPQSVLIAFPNRERPFVGEKTYHLVATGGEVLGVRFRFSEDPRLDTITCDPPPRAGNVQEVFSIESKGGFILNISVSWSGGELTSFHVEPKIHPFSEW